MTREGYLRAVNSRNETISLEREAPPTFQRLQSNNFSLVVIFSIFLSFFQFYPTERLTSAREIMKIRSFGRVPLRREISNGSAKG